MRNPLRFVSVTVSIVLLAGLAACVAPPPMNSAYPMSPNPAPAYPTYPAAAYPAQQGQQGNYVEYGRVRNVEVLRSQQQGQGSGVGAVLGGVAGAVIGHQIGGGSGRDAATIIGGVGGAVAGNAVERNRNATVNETYRVSIQLDNGSMRAYDVPSFGDLRIGDRVKIENGQLYRIM